MYFKVRSVRNHPDRVYIRKHGFAPNQNYGGIVMRRKLSLRRICEIGMIAALYAMLTMILPAFGPWQCRLSEALTVLPVFTPVAIPGLTVGCAIANTVGLASGLNVAGVWDIPIGSAATLLSALATYALRKIKFGGIPVLSTFPPVIFNALIIGAELSVSMTGSLSLTVFLTMAGQVALGQFFPCVCGGVILSAALYKTGLDTRLFSR